MARRWFSRKGLTAESEQFDIVVKDLSRGKMNGQRLLTAADLPLGNQLTMAEIGNNPNENGGSIIEDQLFLQPANQNFGGVVTTSNQQFAGEKQFNAGIYLGADQRLFNTYQTWIATVDNISISSPGVVTEIWILEQTVTNLTLKITQIGDLILITLPYFGFSYTGVNPIDRFYLRTITPWPRIFSFGNGSSLDRVRLLGSNGTTRSEGYITFQNFGPSPPGQPTGNIEIINDNATSWTDSANIDNSQTFVFSYYNNTN